MDIIEAKEEKILVVDDDPAIYQLLDKVLETEGYKPVICSHPHEALAASEKEDFDLAFVDIRLPAMSGLDLAGKLKEHNQKCEVVFMTGFGTLDNAVKAIKMGAYDYLSKPFSIADLKLCLQRFKERQALKKQVRLAEQRYTDLVQNIPLLIFVLRRDFQLDFANRFSSTILGYTPEEAISTPKWFLERIHPESRTYIEKLFRTAFESGGQQFTVESRLIHKKGHFINGIIKSLPYYSHETGPLVEHLQGIVVDITDRVSLERALVQKEKLGTLGAISAEVAHEIRNPLTAIGGFSKRLQKKYPDVKEIDIIFKESIRLEKILDRIKNYLKPVEMRPQKCSVNAVIKHAVDLLTEEMKREHIECRLNLDSELSDAYADSDILRGVAINLIQNTLQSIDKNGGLDILTFESDQNIHVEFRNQNKEQKTKDSELLFLPFAEGGQSIGLPLCYRQLKNMGGFLSFTQETGWDVFSVSLPKMLQAHGKAGTESD